MEEKDLQFFKEKLLELKETCIKGLNHIQEGFLGTSQKEMSGDLSSYTIHMADTAADTYEMEKNLSFASAKSDILADIENALHKIEKNEKYGICEKCQTEIPRKRLEALPYVRFCVPCEEDVERQRNIERYGI
jgi:RNA polymerase-binding transcription factor DksA